ncbi:MAG TPA: hypothetical protein VHF22_04825, partial [Planctomycetota bacterium]|nr:hypothetical protein [Planctomycetota bacterium]
AGARVSEATTDFTGTVRAEVRHGGSFEVTATAGEESATRAVSALPARGGRLEPTDVPLGVPDGPFRVIAARWSVRAACVEDEVTLEVDTVGKPPPGAQAHLKVFDCDDKGDEAALAAELEAPLEFGRVRERWKIAPPRPSSSASTAADLAALGFDHPDLYFEVEVAGARADSGKEKEKLLRVSDVIDAEIHDKETGALAPPGARYEVTLSNGKKRRGALTSESRCYERDVPPGKFDIKVFGDPPGPGEVVPQGDLRRVLAAGGVDVPNAQKAVERRPVRISGVRFSPREAAEGEVVRVSARIEGAAAADAVVVRIFKKGADAPVEELAGRVSGDRVEASWTVAGATGAVDEAGRDSADFAAEVECRGRKARTPAGDPPPLHGYAKDAPELSGLKWSAARACAGDEVSLEATVGGKVSPKRRARLAIFEHAPAGGQPVLVARLDAPIEGGKVKKAWKVAPPPLDPKHETAADLAASGWKYPFLYFALEVAGVKAESGKEDGELLRVEDAIDRQVVDEVSKKPIPGTDYEVTLSNGEKRRGKLTGESRLVERGVPPGKFDLRLFPAGKAMDPKPPSGGLRRALASGAIDAANAERAHARGPISLGAARFRPDAGPVGAPVALEARVAGGADG